MIARGKGDLELSGGVQRRDVEMKETLLGAMTHMMLWADDLSLSCILESCIGL